MLTKAKILFLALIAMSVFLTSCEEETTDDPQLVLPAAPSNLQANSIDSNTVNIKWDLSVDDGTTGFVGYQLTVIDETGAEVISKQAISNYTAGSVVTVESLTEGMIYDFSVVAVNADGVSTATTVKWSPAVRLNETVNEVPIKIYGMNSQFGSGIKMYSEDLDFGLIGPEVLPVKRKAEWHLAFDSNNDGYKFGSADMVTIGSTQDNPTNPAQLSTKVYNESALNNVFDSEALDQATFTNSLADLKDAKYSDYKGLVLVFRVPTATAGVYNYGKILIKKNNTDGGFVFNTNTNDEYIDCVISYQRKEDVPFAKIGL
jgi:hypothetical protein